METSENEAFASLLKRSIVARVLWCLLISPLFFLFFLYALPLLCVALAMMVVTGAYSGVVFHYRVRRSRRYLRWREARERFCEQGGTLIVELNTIGWGTLRFWWTPDRVHELAPCYCPTKEEYDLAFDEMETPEWDRWFYDNYLSLDTGRAAYVGVRANAKRLEKLKSEFPALQIAHTWSAMVGFHLRKLEEEASST